MLNAIRRAGKPGKQRGAMSAPRRSLLGFKTQQPVGVADYGNRRQRHRRARYHRAEQRAGQRVEHAGGDQDTNVL